MAVLERKQTQAHIEKRTRRGAAHYAWQGRSVSERGGRSRALRLFPEIGACAECGSSRAERHHVDGNTANNEPENIRVLCRRCHMLMDGRLVRLAREASERSAQLIAVAAEAKRAQQNCKRGHPLSGDNLYIAPRGVRTCKTCRAMHKKASRERSASCQ